MQNSDDYLFSIKLSNFKIVLQKLIETIEFSDDNTDLDNCIHIGKELIRQFNLILDKFDYYQDQDLAGETRKFENKIKILTDRLNESELLIDDYQTKFEKEKDKSQELEKNLNETNIKIQNYQININELESVHNEKIRDLHTILENDKLKYKNLIEYQKQLQTELEFKNTALEELTEKQQHNHKSNSYIEKLNEGNTKVIQKQGEKIKQLESEIKEYIKKINEDNDMYTEFKNKYNELEHHNFTLETTNIELNNIINLNNNNLKTLDLEVEIQFVKIKDQLKECLNENAKLKDEINNLKSCKDLNDNELKYPLLNDYIYEEKEETCYQKCSICCIC